MAPLVRPDDEEDEVPREPALHGRPWLFRDTEGDQLVHVRVVCMEPEVRLDALAPAVLQFFLVDLKRMAWLAVPANHMRGALESYRPEAWSLEVLTLQIMYDEVWNSDGDAVRILDTSRIDGSDMRDLLDEYMMRTWGNAVLFPPPRVPDGRSIPRTEEPPPAGPWSSSSAPAGPEESGEVSSMHEESETESMKSTDGYTTPESVGLHEPEGPECEEDIFSDLE